MKLRKGKIGLIRYYTGGWVLNLGLVKIQYDIIGGWWIVQ